MYKTHKFRMYPNSKQKELIHKTFGFGYIKAFDTCNEIKRLYIQHPFLKEVDSCSLRRSIRRFI